MGQKPIDNSEGKEVGNRGYSENMEGKKSVFWIAIILQLLLIALIGVALFRILFGVVTCDSFVQTVGLLFGSMILVIGLMSGCIHRYRKDIKAESL